MKKLFSKFFLLLTAVVLTAGFASCSKDDDPDGDKVKGGNMTGWVEIDGKKYDLKYCYNVSEYFDDRYVYLVGASIDMDKELKPNKKFNMAAVGVTVKDNGDVEFGMEFAINFDPTNETCDVDFYADEDGNANKVTYKKNGDKYLVEGKDITFIKAPYNGPNGTATGSFHFEGEPRLFKNMTIE